MIDLLSSTCLECSTQSFNKQDTYIPGACLLSPNKRSGNDLQLRGMNSKNERNKSLYYTDALQCGRKLISGQVSFTAEMWGRGCPYQHHYHTRPLNV